MSDTIKITVVIENEKLNAPFEKNGSRSLIVTHDLSATLMSTLLKNNLISGSFCGGRGDCGRCRVQFLKGMVMPTALERSVMEPEELRQGYRLACLAKPKDDCVIKLALVETPEISIVSDMIAVSENNDHISQQNTQSQNRTSDVMESCGKNDGSHAETGGVQMKCAGRDDRNIERIRTKCAEAVIAVDLGTTTIAMQLIMMDTGRVMDTYCEMNPQRCYGTDVLSRIRASCEGEREILRRVVEEMLERGVARFEKRCAQESASIRCMCIAGNTTMGHLLMGYDVSTLGQSPFTPVEIGLQEYRYPAWKFRVWIVPGISAFVGGDIVAGLYALEMLPGAGQEFCDAGSFDEADLLIDLGTNGEMAITDGRHMIVTATAAGPAFEGGAGAGVVGSDMIACTAQLLRQGILDETGLLAEPYFTEGIWAGNPRVLLRGRDIRDLQMAKAAVRAGIEILWKRMGEPSIGQVCLAGGFGYYLDVEAAFRIGLLPDFMRGKVRAVGNTSLAGAYQIGRDLWMGRMDEAVLRRRLSCIESINLAEQEGFERLYMRCMEF